MTTEPTTGAKAAADYPRFDSCEDVVSPNYHYLDSAFGQEWCECNHVGIVNEYAPHDINPNSLPAWWVGALGNAIDATVGDFDLESTWTQLCELAKVLGADGSWSRWDEFCAHTLEMEPDRAEAFLKLLDKAGIATVAAGAWEYQDGKNHWHSNGCCIEIDVRLNAVPEGGVR